MNIIKVKRIYEESSVDDGYRILVDRLWPRGFTKEKANIDKWAKNISPSTELRKTFNHDAETMDEFTRRYIYELDTNEYSDEFINHVKDRLSDGNVTFLYAAKNVNLNHAIVLMNWVKEKI
jgi:uncharacterized protein YeaO (DUF488 family)